MERYDTGHAPDPFACSMEAVKSLTARLSAPETAELDHAAVEQLIETDGREILRRFFQDHLDLRARHEEHNPPPQEVTGADGVLRPYRETGHARRLTCLFGTVSVTRCAWRSRGLTNVHPVDAELSLPRGRHSHGIKRLAVREAIRSSFDQAVEAIGDRCGKVLGKRRAESLAGVPADTTGKDAAKKVPGRKRGLAVDVLGLVIAVVVLAASAHDNAAGIALLDKVAADTDTVHKALVGQGFKTAVVDHGKKIGIDVEVVERNPTTRGFVPQPIRWRVEQVNGVMMLHRRLVRDYEHRPASAESRVYWAISDRMSRMLTATSTPTWRGA